MIDMALPNAEPFPFDREHLMHFFDHPNQWDGERLGQAFINRFYRGAPWPELYHEEDWMKCHKMIREYMSKNL